MVIFIILRGLYILPLPATGQAPSPAASMRWFLCWTEAIQSMWWIATFVSLLWGLGGISIYNLVLTHQIVQPWLIVGAQKKYLLNVLISQNVLQRLCAPSVSGDPLGYGFLISMENLPLYVKQKCCFFFNPLLILRIKKSLRSLCSTYSLIILYFIPFLSCAFPFALLL